MITRNEFLSIVTKARRQFPILILPTEIQYYANNVIMLGTRDYDFAFFLFNFSSVFNVDSSLRTNIVTDDPNALLTTLIDLEDFYYSNPVSKSGFPDYPFAPYPGF